MTVSEPSYRSILAVELKERQKRNSSYSLRAFARSLGISPTMLSQVLQGKRPITIQSAIKIADALPLSDEGRRIFLKSTYESRDLSSSAGEWKSYFADMPPEEFRLIADPIHFAILALADLKDSRWDADWISDQLDVSRDETQEAMQRLKTLGLVAIDGSRYKQSTSPMRVKSPVSEAAIQDYHRNTLQRALDSLDHDPVDQREFNAVTMAISSEKLDAARELTARYMENMYSLLDNSPEKDRVYTIAVQFFPLNKPRDFT